MPSAFAGLGRGGQLSTRAALAVQHTGGCETVSVVSGQAPGCLDLYVCERSGPVACPCVDTSLASGTDMPSGELVS